MIRNSCRDVNLITEHHLRSANKALHRMAIPPRSIATGKRGRLENPVIHVRYKDLPSG